MVTSREEITVVSQVVSLTKFQLNAGILVIQGSFQRWPLVLRNTSITIFLFQPLPKEPNAWMQTWMPEELLESLRRRFVLRYKYLTIKLCFKFTDVEKLTGKDFYWVINEVRDNETSKGKRQRVTDWKKFNTNKWNFTEKQKEILKREIYLNGPVMACFVAFEDYQHYASGK